MDAIQNGDQANHILNNRYKLLERIGSGGMAGVYKAQDLTLDRIVAVKILHPSYTADENFLAKFRKEAKAAANLSHPNIVTVHDTGNDGDRHYIVMEYVEGATLKQLIKQQPADRPMTIHRVLDLMTQACAGLGYAHRAGLVHCDVKPQNILVTRDERVKVTDFGIARAISEATQTNPQMVWGTPQDLSPEQAQGRPATPASDVYSLGIILYEMLTGELPFSAESHTAIALKHIHEAPPLISQINPAIPLPLEEILVKVLSKDPSARYRTAGQFGRILSTYREKGIVVNEEAETVVPLPEQPTQMHPRLPRPMGNEKPLEMTRPKPVLSAEPEQSTVFYAPSPKTDSFLIFLSIVAVIALLGLIPLWLAVAHAWGVF